METFATKVCPQCGQELFEDMEVCYGCLHSFADRSREASEPFPGLPALDEPDMGDGPEPEPGSGPGSGSAQAFDGRMMLKISTGDAQTTTAVPQAGLIIGRDPLSDVVLKSRAVSKRHARVIPLSSAVIVEDLGSTNPVTYKGREIGETAVVHVGERFEICGTTFTVVA